MITRTCRLLGEEEEVEETEEEAIPTKASQRHSSYRETFSYVKRLVSCEKDCGDSYENEAWYWIKRLVIKDAAVSKGPWDHFYVWPIAVHVRDAEDKEIRKSYIYTSDTFPHALTHTHTFLIVKLCEAFSSWDVIRSTHTYIYIRILDFNM